MLDSIHVARWLEQFREERIHFTLFPSSAAKHLHPRILELVSPPDQQQATFEVHPFSRILSFPLGFVDQHFGMWTRGQLLRLIHGRGRWNFIHALEFQHAGYACLAAFGGSGPPAPLIATNWGSDIYWFQQFPSHLERIKKLLGIASRYSAECNRDALLAQEHGFRGQILPVIPNAGGFSTLELEMGGAAPAPSHRRMILVKGYDKFVGLAHVALDAIESCYDVLEGYQVVVYSAGPSVQERVSLMAGTGAIDIVAVAPYHKSHSEMLELFRQARIYVGMSKSDGISTSLLEALVSGCFPIQSATSCADEWITDGVTGFLIDNPDAALVAHAIRRALTDDTLIDQATRENLVTVEQRLEDSVLKQEALQYYQ